MSEQKSSSSSFAGDLWARMIERVSKLNGATLAWGGLALGAVILLSVNLIISMSLRGWKADLTEDRLFTISNGTRVVLRSIDEPIKARVYFSKKLGEMAPSYANYFGRIRALLEQYRDISGGKLVLEFQDPEPFSDAEDQAVGAGLRGMRINAEGETGYFGLVASNATDNQETIAFFSPDRESFVEYDITKLIHSLTNPKKRVVGLITALPLDGGKAPMGGSEQVPTPAWLIMDQIREFFEVENIEQTATEIPSRVDVLLVAQPTGLTPAAAYAIDQYALKGGKVLVFIDPQAEAAYFQLLQQTGEGKAELAKLLKSWGVDFDPKKVATDIKHARRVQFGGRGGDSMVTEYVAWLGLDRSAIDEGDVLSSGIEVINVGSSGFFTKTDGASTQVTPILRTSTDAMEVPVQSVGQTADPVALLRGYKPGGKSLMLAARIAGETKTAFPDGAPNADARKGEPAKTEAKPGETPAPETKKDDAAAKPAGPGPNHVASGRINAIVVADTDILADRFWVETREMMGQQMVTPLAHNAAFVVGALENLTGSDDLIALRGRGVKERPFTLVESIRRDAEREFREKEQALTEKLRNVEQELKKLEAAGEGSSVVLTDAERQAIEKFRGEMLSTRRELRNVKLALRHDIDGLDGWLKFTNIALVPLAIGLVGIGWSIRQSRQRKKSS
jgi:ABC-type uncharacterized transport system involved in gliding motility auxiliary subunit